MRFTKLQGTGNDFIVVDARVLDRDWAKLARVMCDRHFGIGADGLILVLPSHTADLRMRMFNPDGSEAETCGNGLRCFAKYAIENGLAPGPGLVIETLAGATRAAVTLSSGKVVSAKVTMGRPRLDPEAIPVLLGSKSSPAGPPGPVVDYPLRVEGHRLRLTFVSMGNPHAVAFIDEPVATFALTSVGPAVENHPMFPRRVNFEIARFLDEGTLEARVWERGAGETLACGSGACAIAVAARLRGTARDTLDIRLSGGTLTVTWDGRGEVYLSGPVAQVFTGEYIE